MKMLGGATGVARKRLSVLTNWIGSTLLTVDSERCPSSHSSCLTSWASKATTGGFSDALEVAPFLLIMFVLLVEVPSDLVS